MSSAGLLPFRDVSEPLDSQLRGQPDRRLQRAGAAASPLMADPKSWINRRVETVELLSREETRRRVSIDFTLSDEQLENLWVEGEGVVVPISALTKERRRTWDLSDENGRAIPVLGFQQNGDLALFALLGAALEALPEGVDVEDLAAIVPELSDIVFEPPKRARAVYKKLLGQAAEPESLQSKIDGDPAYRSLLETLWGNYVLCAVLPRGGPNRRILKYGYSEDLQTPEAPQEPDEAPERVLADEDDRPTLRERLEQRWRRIRFPDQRDFHIPFPGAWRARSFHAEIVIPEELRFADAVLKDFNDQRDVSACEQNVNRASLYATRGVEPDQDVAAVVWIGPEPGGRTSQAALTGGVVALMLWLGVASGLRVHSPDAAVSIVVGGAALYAGITAVLGEPLLVSTIFKTTRRWLTVVTLSAVAGSASLALEVPTARPVWVWVAAAALCTVAALRLAWSSRRAGAYTGLVPRPEETR